MIRNPHKGRTGRALVTEAAVRRMRFRHSYEGATAQELAAEYDIGLDACRKILKWQSWRWVSEAGPGATEAEHLAAASVPQRKSGQALEDEIAASQARLLAKAGVRLEDLPKAPPFLEEVLRREAERGAAKDEEVLGKVQAPRGEQLLKELDKEDL